MIWKQELFILNIYFNEKERKRERERNMIFEDIFFNNNAEYDVV